MSAQRYGALTSASRCYILFGSFFSVPLYFVHLFERSSHDRPSRPSPRRRARRSGHHRPLLRAGVRPLPVRHGIRQGARGADEHDAPARAPRRGRTVGSGDDPRRRPGRLQGAKRRGVKHGLQERPARSVRVRDAQGRQAQQPRLDSEDRQDGSSDSTEMPLPSHVPPDRDVNRPRFGEEGAARGRTVHRSRLRLRAHAEGDEIPAVRGAGPRAAEDHAREGRVPPRRPLDCGQARQDRPPRAASTCSRAAEGPRTTPRA